MGNIVSHVRANVSGIATFLAEIPDINYEKSLGSSRFLKSCKCKHSSGPILVKLFVKPENINLGAYLKQITDDRDTLRGIPNLLPFETLIETERACYAIRQFLFSSLYDRISTRPFLSNLEKRWIAFQLLTAVVECHARDVYHGDIKSENVLVTSWNWVYLTDFSNFKPVYLPDNNPADFSFFFDTSSRRICYLAPERFKSSLDDIENAELTPEMDIFSLGCTIAEIFLEGNPLFTFSQLLQYRVGEYDPMIVLEKIQDEEARKLIHHMISLNPKDRHPSHIYMQKWRDVLFPDYFYSFLHHYMASISEAQFGHSDQSFHVYLTTNDAPLFAYADCKLERLYNDFENIARALKLNTGKLEVFKKPLPFVVNIPGFVPGTYVETPAVIIFVTLISSLIRNCLYPTSKLHAIDMLFVLGQYLEDEHKLDRIVPYLVCLLSDQHPLVRVTSLKCLTQTLSSVKSVTIADANIFPEYILPALKPLSSDPEVIVRAAYAQCLSSISECSLNFLELAEVLKTKTNLEIDMDNVFFHISYDTNLRNLLESIQEEVVALLTDSESFVKRALLSEMTGLCVFFGRQRTNDVILSHLITYLNDSDWQMRSSFCEAIVGIATFVGSRSLEEFILPLMIQALTDSEEVVVEKVIYSLTVLAEIGLIESPRLNELAAHIIPLFCHPNRWIVMASVGFLVICSKVIPAMDRECVLMPLVRPFLRREISDFSETSILENIKNPIRRVIYEHSLKFAQDNKRNSDLLQQLQQFNLTDDERTCLFALKYYISKAGAARSRISSPKKPDATFNVIPHTVFLTPPTSDSPKIRSRAASTSTLRLSQSGTRGNFDLTADIKQFQEKLRLSGRFRQPSQVQTETAFTVDGQEKYIRPLLELKRKEVFPPSLPDIGRRSKPKKAVAMEWKPSGVLVGCFIDHQEIVNQIVMAPDHALFASCSKDKTVKIWDSKRLVTNVTNRARLSYNGHLSSVNCVAFVEGTHSIISGSDDEIHLNRYLKFNARIEYMSRSETSTKYTGIPLVRKHLDGCQKITHFDAGTESLVVFSTLNDIQALDLRSMKIVWKLHSPEYYGRITAMCLDSKHNWLATGTHRGVVSIWDIRYHVELDSWMHPAKSQVTQLMQYQPNSTLLAMSIENISGELSVWDIEKRSCMQVWCNPPGSTEDLNEMYKNFTPLPSPKLGHYEDFELTNSWKSPKHVNKRHFCIDWINSIIISGGNDRKLHYYNTKNPDQNFIFTSRDNSCTKFTNLEYQNINFTIEHQSNNQYQSPRVSRLSFREPVSPWTLREPAYHGHQSMITAIELCKESKPMVITGAHDGTIKVWQ